MTDLAGGSAGCTRSMHDRFFARRRDEMEPFGGELLDALRRLERVDLETQLAADFFFGGALAVHLFDLVAVPQQLEMLPGGKEQHDDEKSGEAGGLPQLALTRFVDLAHDRVVANVLLDGVFERLHIALRRGCSTRALQP